MNRSRQREREEERSKQFFEMESYRLIVVSRNSTNGIRGSPINVVREPVCAKRSALSVKHKWYGPKIFFSRANPRRCTVTSQTCSIIPIHHAASSSSLQLKGKRKKRREENEINFSFDSQRKTKSQSRFWFHWSWRRSSHNHKKWICATMYLCPRVFVCLHDRREEIFLSAAFCC